MARKRSRKRPAETRDRPELKEAGRAQLGPDDESRPSRPRSEDASVEDPLQDWPEDAGKT